LRVVVLLVKKAREASVGGDDGRAVGNCGKKIGSHTRNVSRRSSFACENDLRSAALGRDA
jgi:hypothetical protein